MSKVGKALIEKIFYAGYMQRWNDQIRPVELFELDKQAHKMIIAYVLGRFEEEKQEQKIDWIAIIEGGIFEFFQRVVTTDLKPPIFYEIKSKPGEYCELKKFVYDEISLIISPFGDDFCKKFENYFNCEDDTLNKRILSAAHNYASKWEFKIIKHMNFGHELDLIEKELEKREKKYFDLEGMRNLAIFSGYKEFVDLCGQLRFQLRWSHLHIIPKTSVLGHMLIVAMISYFFSLEINADNERCINNYFTGLFHDLPEILTRDISSPIKKKPGLEALIKNYEKKKMKEEIYNLIPLKWHKDIKMYTENEFTNINKKSYLRDGDLVEAADKLAAFMEAYLAVQNGIRNQEFIDAMKEIKSKWENKKIKGINLKEIYNAFPISEKNSAC